MSMKGIACSFALALTACGGASHDGGAAPPAGAGSGAVGATDAGSGGSSSGSGGSAGRNDAASAGESTEAGAAGADAGPCGITDFDGLRVYSSGGWDPLGYPPYALDGCTLVYVAPSAPGATGGALYRRDLATGQEILLETAVMSPRRPAVAGELIAWEADVGGRSQVRVRYQNQTRDIVGQFDHAGEPRVAPDALVFTAFLGTTPESDTDVLLYDPVRDSLAPVAAGAGQQRFADVSLDYVAVTDFSEDPQGYFNEVDSIADVLVVERATGKTTTRQREGKQAFPLLGKAGALVYLDWGSVHPEPKFSQFSLRAGSVIAPVDADVDLKGEPIHTDPAYVRPSLRGLNVDYIDTQAGSVGLYRVALGRASAPVLTPIVGSPQLFGPVAAEQLTLVSQPLAGQTLALTAVAR